jgi:hypothetical protein
VLPIDPPMMKIAREDIEKIGGFLSEIVNHNKNDFIPIVSACLTTLYQLVASPGKLL